MDWIYIHRTFVYCWYQCSSIIIGDSARRIRIIILTCIDTNRFESLRHPRSPLNGEIYPRHICKEDWSGSYIIHDGRLRAGYARVTTRQGVERRKKTKNTLQYFEDEAASSVRKTWRTIPAVIFYLAPELHRFIPVKIYQDKSNSLVYCISSCSWFDSTTCDFVLVSTPLGGSYVHFWGKNRDTLIISICKISLLFP